jgi:exosome complex exonuclease DIS3/RRP44
VEREPRESANDRNDRAIRRSALWYNKHLSDISPDAPVVVLLTNDVENKEKAVKDGLIAFTGNG